MSHNDKAVARRARGAAICMAAPSVRWEVAPRWGAGGFGLITQGSAALHPYSCFIARSSQQARLLGSSHKPGTEQRRKWVQDRVALSNELQQRLKESYVLALDFYRRHPWDESFLALLDKFPPQRELQRASPKQLEKYLPKKRRAAGDPADEETLRERIGASGPRPRRATCDGAMRPRRTRKDSLGSCTPLNIFQLGCGVSKTCEVFDSAAIGEAEEHVADRLRAVIDVAARLQRSAAGARQQYRQVAVRVTVGVGVAAAVNDHRIVQ